MVGFSGINSHNSLNVGKKGLPAFGSSATPSFGNSVEYHDEFVSSREDKKLTPAKVGLFALVGLAVGGAVALLFKKPAALEEAGGKFIEVELKEESLLGKVLNIFKRKPSATEGFAEGAERAEKEPGVLYKIAALPFRIGIGVVKLPYTIPRAIIRAPGAIIRKIKGSEATEVGEAVVEAVTVGQTAAKEHGRLYNAVHYFGKEAKEARKAAKRASEFEGLGEDAFKVDETSIDGAAKSVSDTGEASEALKIEKGEKGEAMDTSGTAEATDVADDVAAVKNPAPITILTELDKQGIKFLDGHRKASEELIYKGVKDFETMWKDELPARLAKLNKNIDAKIAQSAVKGKCHFSTHRSERNDFIRYAQARAKENGYKLTKIEKDAYGGVNFEVQRIEQQGEGFLKRLFGKGNKSAKSTEKVTTETLAEVERPAGDVANQVGDATTIAADASSTAKPVETAKLKTAKQIANELKDVEIKTAETNLLERIKAERKDYLKTQDGYKDLNEAEFEAEFDKHWTPSKNEVLDHENHYIDTLISQNEAKINYDGIGPKRVYDKEKLEYAKAYAKQKGYNLVIEEGIRNSIEINLEKIQPPAAKPTQAEEEIRRQGYTFLE